MDKTSDCCNHNILTSGGPCGTSGAHPTNTGAQSQSSQPSRILRESPAFHSQLMLTRIQACSSRILLESHAFHTQLTCFSRKLARFVSVPGLLGNDPVRVAKSLVSCISRSPVRRGGPGHAQRIYRAYAYRIVYRIRRRVYIPYR